MSQCDNFCVLPWYGVEYDLRTNRRGICCWLRDEDIDRDQLQQQFKQHAKPEVCDRCWQSESRGIQSRRQMESGFLDHKLDRDLVLIQQDASENRAYMALVQLYLGSTCNGTCVTCGPGSSTAWQSLVGTTISIRPETQQVRDNFQTLTQSLDWSRVQRINLLGGEPLLIEQSWQVFELLARENNFDCRVSFVTNGSVLPNARQIDLLTPFRDVSCCVSVDGLGLEFEYLRWPLKWEQVCRNIDLYRDIFSEVTISYTVSNLNWHSRDRTIEWFNQQGLHYIENYVQTPAWFNYQVNPEHALWPKFVQEIQRQDKLKRICIADYVPHIHDLITKSGMIQPC